MEKINQHFEQKPELAAVPIFRSNELYDALFPEIEPTFRKGEEPTAKGVFEAMMKYQGKHIILDVTCMYAIASYMKKIKLEDLPVELGLTEVPDDETIRELMHQKFGITYSCKAKESIDTKVDALLDTPFSSETALALFELAKIKNEHINRVYIIEKHLYDHTEGVPNEEVMQILKDQSVKAFGAQPIVIQSMEEVSLTDDDMVFVDRHNSEASKLNPKQSCWFPLASALYAEEKVGADNSIIKSLRKGFEK